MLGGAYLCYEGAEKVLHSLHARKHKEDPQARQQRLEAVAGKDPKAFERDKVKGAVRTDFILSAEIVAITLGIVADAPLLNGDHPCRYRRAGDYWRLWHGRDHR